MAEDKQVKKYFENMPYGDDAKVSEIHGKHNQVIINNFIASLVRKYDEAIASDDKEMASHYSAAIRRMGTDLDNLKGIKEEFAVNYGGGTGGKNQFSNYTDLSFDRAFFIENGKINFDEKLRPVLVVDGSDGEIVKGIEDITEDWVVKGTGENTFMKMQQDCVKQGNSTGQPLDFDIDWAVSNLLSDQEAWKSFATDKIGGRYFLHDYLQENQEALANGEIPDEKLAPDSFNPDFDNRLHEYYANRLRKSFDPNYQTPAEAKETDELMAKINTKTTES